LKVVSEINDYESFLSIQKEWNALLEKCPNDTIFLRHEWFKCWWDTYGQRKQLCILLVREDGKLLGIGPFMALRAYFRGLPVKIISFIENDETPRSNVICIDKHEEIIEEMITYLTEKKRSWDLICLNKIPANNGSYEVISSVCAMNKLPFIAKTSWRSPFLKIEGDWDSFYKNTSQKFKKRHRSINNRIKRLGDISITNVTKPQDVESTIAEVFSIGETCWKHKIRKAISSTRENRQFFSKLASIASTQGWLSLWILKMNKKPVAFEYHLQYKGSVHGLRSEFDEKYAEFSPGAVLDGYIVQNIFQRGFREYDMGGSADEYKKHWTPNSCDHMSILIFNNSIYSKLLSFLERNLIPHIKKSKLFGGLKDTIKKFKKRL
jgi:CelD/BcsL family acetyltransferase involved in cellulose biosynthesis